MKRWSTPLAGSVKALAAAALVSVATAAGAVDANRLSNADKDPNNWLMYAAFTSVGMNSCSPCMASRGHSMSLTAELYKV